MSRIYDAIRAAIDTDERSRYRISQDTGISESLLSRFMSDERGLHIERIELLIDYLNLEIDIRPKRKRKGK